MKSIHIVVFSVILLIATKSYSQNNIRFGLQAGVNFQNLTGTDYEGKKLSNEIMFGFHAGINVQIPLVPQFFIQPGILFSTKGAQDSEDGFTSRINLSYIEVPIHFLYKAALGQGSVLIGFGPYFGYAVNGKYKIEGDGESTESDIEFKDEVSEDDPFSVLYLKPLDIGGSVFAGYEMLNGLSFQLNTQLGMIDINPDDKRIQDDESSLKNTGFGVSVGFRF